MNLTGAANQYQNTYEGLLGRRVGGWGPETATVLVISSTVTSAAQHAVTI
jgi:hypothetical protein